MLGVNYLIFNPDQNVAPYNMYPTGWDFSHKLFAISLFKNKHYSTINNKQYYLVLILSNIRHCLFQEVPKLKDKF